jgi:cytochrome c oxidase subunit III
MSTAKHHPHQAHHFDSMAQQFDAAKFGTWLFLCTEILMFGGLFVGYIIYHQLYPETFAEGAKQLNWKLGAVNTVVLLFSSVTMALAINSIQRGKNQLAMNYLVVTFICGLIFMVVKYFEYTHKFHLGYYPGKFLTAEHEAANLGLYFSFYFCMTGLHGSHVLAGMGLIAWSWWRTKRGDFDPEYYQWVECSGLFWHLVDLIWIYLFPLLYLIG